MTIYLQQPDHAYFFGFMQGDGHFYINRDKPNKGCIGIELAKRDYDLLVKFKSLFPGSSTQPRKS